jgi:hypothetical protein
MWHPAQVFGCITPPFLFKDILATECTESTEKFNTDDSKSKSPDGVLKSTPLSPLFHCFYDLLFPSVISGLSVANKPFKPKSHGAFAHGF